MKEKEQPEMIHKAIISIMRELKAIDKGKTNQQQGYKFRGIDDMYNALHPLFSKHGLYITSNVLDSRQTERITAKGGTLIYTIVKMQFFFIAEDGSNVCSIIEGEAMDSGDKSTNKAMSTALKYAVMQMFLIPTEDLKDSDSDTYTLGDKSSNKQTPPVKQPITAPGKDESNVEGMMQKKTFQDQTKVTPTENLNSKPTEGAINFEPDAKDKSQNPVVQKIVNRIGQFTDHLKLKSEINNILEYATKNNCTEAEINLIRKTAEIHFNVLKTKAR